MPWSAWAHSHTDFNTQREFAASSAAIQLGIVALISKRDQVVNARLMSMSSGMHLTSQGTCKLEVCMQMSCGVSLRLA